MNTKLPHLFSVLTMMALCTSTHTADFEGWGRGTPVHRGGSQPTTPTLDDRNGPRAAALSSLTPVASSPALTGGRETPPSSSSTSSTNRLVWGSESSLSVPQPSREELLQENEQLRRSLALRPATAPATLQTELADPQALPVLSIRWINLIHGYPDPSKINYDPRTRQYYDASTGIFPFKQPPIASLSNKLGPEVKVWEARINAAREAYKTAYLDWQSKEERFTRKTVDDALKSAESLPDNPLSANLPQNAKEVSELQKREAIVKGAEIDAKRAKGAFEKLQEEFIAQHPTECKNIDGERHLTFLTPDELERKFIWGFVEKPLPLIYTTLIHGQSHDPKKYRAFLLTDPVDIRFGIHMLSWMVPHLEREYEIFVNILTHYKRDFVPKVTGIFSIASWTDWLNSSSANVLKAKLKETYPSSSIARFQEPKTDEQETLRILRRDALGSKLHSRYLDEIKRYQDVALSDVHEKFFKVYQGQDHLTATAAQTTYLNPKRVFPNPQPTPFLSIQTRFQPATPDEGSLLPEGVEPFVLPKGVRMASEYVSPKVMGFHRDLWPHVMGELKVKGQSALKPPSLGLGGAAEYANLFCRYERIVKNITHYLEPLDASPSKLIPAPFAFFFTSPLESKAIPANTIVTLEEFGITDQDLTHRRLLPDGRSEPVLHRYEKVSLARNALQNPNPTVFGTTLTSLDVSSNQLRGLEFAVPLTGLKDLDVSHQFLNSLSPFGNDSVAPLQNLKRFILAHTGLSQIAPIAGFTSLRVLDLSENNIVTVAPLVPLVALEDLILAKNQITDLSPLDALYNLRRLNVSLNPLQTLKSLVKLEGLQVLIADECPKFKGDYREILPIAKEEADPRLKGLLHLQLRRNDIGWLPYLNQRNNAYSSNDVQRNDALFSTSFPALQTLQVGSNAELKGTGEAPIKLSLLMPK